MSRKLKLEKHTGCFNSKWTQIVQLDFGSQKCGKCWTIFNQKFKRWIFAPKLHLFVNKILQDFETYNFVFLVSFAILARKFKYSKSIFFLSFWPFWRGNSNIWKPQFCFYGLFDNFGAKVQIFESYNFCNLGAKIQIFEPYAQEIWNTPILAQKFKCSKFSTTLKLLW